MTVAEWMELLKTARPDHVGDGGGSLAGPYRNLTAHDYGEGFAKETMALLPAFIADSREVWAYGSRVTGQGHETSDLDLVVRNPENPQVEIPGVADLKEAFTESDLPIWVDVVEWARVPESFQRNIEEKYVVVYGGPHAKTIFRE